MLRIDADDAGIRTNLSHGPSPKGFRESSVIITNVKEIAQAIDKRNAKDHPSRDHEDGRAASRDTGHAAEFCDAILYGLKKIIGRERSSARRQISENWQPVPQNDG